MPDIFISILLVLLGLGVGIVLMVLFNYIKGVKSAEKADNILETAKTEAEKIKRDSLNEAKEEANQLKVKAENEVREKKDEIKKAEQRLDSRESNIDRRDESLQNRENQLEEKEQSLVEKQDLIQDEQAKLEEIKKEQTELLQKIAGYSKEKAREKVLKQTEEEMATELSVYIKEKEAEAALTIDKTARDMLVSSMQRYAADVASEQTVTVVGLPSEEMKGRIIGREGRNIRTIEAVTGVDLIIDDTPEAIVLSSFDALRREIARATIETLIKDGRIHPSRIEELYDKTAKEMKAKIMEYGDAALFELGITKVDPEIIELLGKLHFRTSYGQNVLSHSIEMAHLAGIMAAEMGENVVLAKRAALLHDIGKAIDHEMEGSHIELGANIARKHKENDTVINAIESHHGDVESTSVISEIVAIADVLSASRPGARNDSLENYVQRLHDLENIANQINGIDKAFAMQAGRELRVIVKPDEIDDSTSHKVARDIKKKIEEQLQYPGTIRVTVIRETRATEEAK